MPRPPVLAKKHASSLRRAPACLGVAATARPQPIEVKGRRDNGKVTEILGGELKPDGSHHGVGDQVAMSEPALIA